VSYVAEIVCFAASARPGGLCFAGKHIETEQWIRPIGDRPSHEIKPGERMLGVGRAARTLDVLRIGLDRAEPNAYQTENHVIDGSRWVKSGRIGVGELDDWLDPVEPLWHHGSSTIHGRNDKIPAWRANQLTSSLRLIKVNDLVIIVQDESYDQPKTGVRARFTYSGAQHLIGITDPPVYRAYIERAIGQYPIGAAYLCVSIGEVFHGYAYKIAAGVFF
jgi:hypothetical protein